MVTPGSSGGCGRSGSGGGGEGVGGIWEWRFPGRAFGAVGVVWEGVVGAGRQPRRAWGAGRRAGEGPPRAGYGPGTECPGCP